MIAPAEALSPEQAQAQDVAIAALEALGGTLRRQPNGFVSASLASNSKITDAAMQHVAAIPNLSILSLDASPVGDTGIAQLRGLKHVNMLSLRDTKITDVSLQHIAGYNQLQFLTIGQTKITDDGLKHIAQLPLGALNLTRTGIGDAGLNHLTQLPLLTAHLKETKVTDAGLATLGQLESLRLVDVKQCPVTPAGVQKLQQQRPGLKVEFTPPSN